jgi:hypothetical protein
MIFGKGPLFVPQIPFPITGSTVCSKAGTNMITRQQALSEIDQAKSRVEG